MEIALIIALFLYLLPTVIAFCRGHASKWAILLVNLFFGWSLIGWFWSLIWSLANKGASQSVVINNVNNNG